MSAHDAEPPYVTRAGRALAAAGNGDALPGWPKQIIVGDASDGPVPYEKTLAALRDLCGLQVTPVPGVQREER